MRIQLVRKSGWALSVAMTMAMAMMAASAWGADERAGGGGPAYKNTALPFEKRAADLVSRMTLEEKAEQAQFAVEANLRLGIPACSWWSEALHGYGRMGRATIYPQAIGLAATWDPGLIKEIGSATGDEARAKFDPTTSERFHGIILWSPTVNLVRDPRWGRVEETYGEDPWLTSRIAVAYVQGLQGDDPKYLKTVATPKHFAVYSQETARVRVDAEISEAQLHDYYLVPFRACFVEGNAASTMAAHNAINGVPCAANSWLLTDLLRKDWGFSGAVVSDFNTVSQLISGQKYVWTDDQAVAAAFNAGLDVISDGHSNPQAIVRAVGNRLLPIGVLDRAVQRNVTVRMRLGMFDPPSMVPYSKITPEVIGSKEHIALALQAARESTVLLKNDAAPKGHGFEKLLPMDLRKIDSIAVIGPYADRLQFGAYSADEPAEHAPTILEGLRNAVGDRIQVTTADYNDVERSVRAAENATMAVVVMGLNKTMEHEGSDRQTLELPTAQQDFLESVVRANPLTIVVLEGGSPVGLEWMKAHVPAIVNAWYPGEQGGNAIAEILTGQCNPSGRLPLTYFRSINDLPPLDDYDITHGRTYMYAQRPVTYAFGHGVSYTKFDYSKLDVPAQANAHSMLTISAEVANTGAMDGDEVAQLYVRKVQGTEVRPSLQLKGFVRVTIPKGESQTVKLQLAASDLATWNTARKQFVVEPGSYEIMIGASSADIRLRGKVDIKQ